LNLLVAKERPIRMKVSLFYNEDAGDGVSLDDIRELLERHGHELVHHVEGDSDAGRLLDEPSELVAVAGGDGTVAAAARVLAGSGVPLAILPVGTANNVARSLGIEGPIADVIKAWDHAKRRPLDLGVASGTWGKRRFLEGAGGGLIPIGIAESKNRKIDGNQATDKVANAARKYRDVLARLTPRECTMSLDGTEVTAGLLLVEVLNISAVGPNLVLSPDADPSDGLFSVVFASEEHREMLDAYLQQRIEGRESHLSLPAYRAQHVEIQGLSDLHIDDKIVHSDPPRTVSIRIEPAALETLS
jgi:diacylglycerol kinase family enzyme